MAPSNKFLVYNFGVRPVIILFAKAPVPGRVKTRLVPPLTAAAAAELHSAFVLDVVERLQQLRDVADLELHTDIPTDAWPLEGVPRRLQYEGDLGLKMFQALRDALQRGRSQALIVGSDAPTLPAAHIRALLDSSADVMLGPCDDGGYYAIACRRVDAAMFDGVPWSSPDSLDQTAAAARRCGLTVDFGPRWYDVDTPADLERLAGDAELPRRTAKMLLRCRNLTS